MATLVDDGERTGSGETVVCESCGLEHYAVRCGYEERLRALTAPVADLDLDDRELACLRWLAIGRGKSDVVARLLARARAAPPQVPVGSEPEISLDEFQELMLQNPDLQSEALYLLQVELSPEVPEDDD